MGKTAVPQPSNRLASLCGGFRICTLWKVPSTYFLHRIFHTESTDVKVLVCFETASSIPTWPLDWTADGVSVGLPPFLDVFEKSEGLLRHRPRLAGQLGLGSNDMQEMANVLIGGHLSIIFNSRGRRGGSTTSHLRPRVRQQEARLWLTVVPRQPAALDDVPRGPSLTRSV